MKNPVQSFVQVHLISVFRGCSSTRRWGGGRKYLLDDDHTVERIGTVCADNSSDFWSVNKVILVGWLSGLVAGLD